MKDDMHGNIIINKPVWSVASYFGTKQFYTEEEANDFSAELRVLLTAKDIADNLTNKD